MRELENPVSVPCKRIGPRDLCKVFHDVQDALDTKGEDKPALWVELDDGYIDGMYKCWEDLMKAVRERTEIRGEFTHMTMEGGVSRGNREWQVGCMYSVGKVTIQPGGTEKRWKRKTMESLVARFRAIHRKRALPLALSQTVSFGAVAVMLVRDWSQILVGQFSPLSVIVLILFALAISLPVWVLRPAVNLDERVEVRIADLLPWLTVAFSAAKLLEPFWHR